jgi:hypothetical protein
MACWDEMASERSTRYHSFGCAPAPISLIIFSGSLFFKWVSVFEEKRRRKKERNGEGDEMCGLRVFFVVAVVIFPAQIQALRVEEEKLR